MEIKGDEVELSDDPTQPSMLVELSCHGNVALNYYL